jgi:hypothetical protein
MFCSHSCRLCCCGLHSCRLSSGRLRSYRLHSCHLRSSRFHSGRLHSCRLHPGRLRSSRLHHGSIHSSLVASAYLAFMAFFAAFFMAVLGCVAFLFCVVIVDVGRSLRRQPAGNTIKVGLPPTSRACPDRHHAMAPSTNPTSTSPPLPSCTAVRKREASTSGVNAGGFGLAAVRARQALMGGSPPCSYCRTFPGLLHDSFAEDHSDKDPPVVQARVLSLFRGRQTVNISIGRRVSQTRTSA